MALEHSERGDGMGRPGCGGTRWYLAVLVGAILLSACSRSGSTPTDPPASDRTSAPARQSPAGIAEGSGTTTTADGEEIPTPTTARQLASTKPIGEPAWRNPAVPYSGPIPRCEEIERTSVSSHPPEWYEANNQRIRAWNSRRGVATSASGGPNIWDSITVSLWSPDEASVAEVVAALGDEDICIDGDDPVPFPVDIRVGFRLLDVAVGTAVPVSEPFIAVFTTREEYDDFAATSLPQPWPSNDFATAVVVAFSVDTDACPPIVGDITVVDRTVRPILTNPGYHGCDDPLFHTLYILSIDRSVLPLGKAEFAHPTADAAVEVSLEETSDGVESNAGAETSPSTLATVGPLLDIVPLPPTGDAEPRVLADGTPVFVVHHPEGRVSVIDVRAPSRTWGLSGPVVWATGTRRFMGGGRTDLRGVWDEYGRGLDRGRHLDLFRFEAEATDDGVVLVRGSRRTAEGDPITGLYIGPSGRRVLPVFPAPIPLQEALNASAGTTVMVDAVVTRRGAEPAHLCEMDLDTRRSSPLRLCPSDSSIVEGAPPINPGACSWLGNPIMVTRTEAGFERVMAPHTARGAGGLC
jgi:hypothetical protein